MENNILFVIRVLFLTRMTQVTYLCRYDILKSENLSRFEVLHMLFRHLDFPNAVAFVQAAARYCSIEPINNFLNFLFAIFQNECSLLVAIVIFSKLVRLLSVCQEMARLQLWLVEVVALLATILLLKMVQVKMDGEAVAMEVLGINIEDGREFIQCFQKQTDLILQLIHNLFYSLHVFAYQLSHYLLN